MPGTLYVVATPIGNLEDITLRALRVLREVAVIAAEDTRRTARLLQHYSISTSTTSLHQHNERARVPALLARLQAGDSVALVSDAGTPLMSDPGAMLVSAAHGAGVRVEPVPGPSAALAALSGSGFPAAEVLFLGFPPSRSGARRRWLERLRDESRVMVLYEAPHRVEEMLRDALLILGDRPIALGRELTKAHEELVVRPISRHLLHLREPRGEYTLVFTGRAQLPAVPPPLPAGEELAREFGQLSEREASDRRQVVRELAEKYRVSPKEMYQRVEEALHSRSNDQ